MKLSSTGKWLLDSTGKAKICSCCGCACADKCYWYQISGCTAIDHSSHMQNTFTGGTDICDDPMEASFFDDDNNIDTSISLARSGGVLTLSFNWTLGGVVHYWSVVIEDECPLGIYTLGYDSADGTPVCTDDLTVTIEEELCCGSGASTHGPYYLSCDVQWDEWTDVDCDMTDCDGNGGGGNTVHSVSETNALTDEPASMLAAPDDDPCYLESDNAFSGFFPECGSDKFFIQRLTSNEWQVVFGLCTDGDYRFKTLKLGGLTPVGTYPDIDYCYNDGCTATHVTITNIVVTA